MKPRGVVRNAVTVAAASIGIAILALRKMKETFLRDLDYLDLDERPRGVAA